MSTDLVTGGAALMGIGAIGLVARTLWGRFSSLLESQCCVFMEVSSQDRAFAALLDWIAKHPRHERYRALAVSADTGGNDAPVPCGVQREVNAVQFSLAPGTHLLQYGRHWLWVTRQREQQPAFGGTVIEWLRFRILARDPLVARRLIEEAVAGYLAGDPSEVSVMTCGDGYWSLGAKRTARTLDSVILPEGQMEMLLADCRQFLAAEEWYARMGLPYRRGYLLHGVPGSGKTTSVLAVAAALGRSVWSLSLSASGMNDTTLNRLMLGVRRGSIILIEDVDVAFPTRRSEKQDAGASQVTLAGLLGALDGAVAQEGCLVFMTTNHPEALDPAIIRPGRADYHLEFSYATAAQAERLFRRFFPGAEHAARQFGVNASRRPVTVADLQQHLLLYRDAPAEVAAELDRATVSVT